MSSIIKTLPVNETKALKSGSSLPCRVESLEINQRAYHPINKKTVGGFFFAVLILLIFFSKTIYAHNLPVVTAVKPENGRLSKLEISSGFADWAEIEKLYIAVGGTVDEVLVKEGDSVTAGQELLRLSFDRDEAEHKLSEFKNSKSKLNVDIQNINLRIEKLERYIADLQSETYEEDEVSQYELELLEIDIRKARAEYNELKEQNSSGNVSEFELDRARYSLQSLYTKQEELENKLEKQREDAKKTFEGKEKSRETKLLDYMQEIAALKLDRQNKYTDANNLLLQEEPYQKVLEDFEAYAAVKSPVAGTVISIDVGKGETVRDAQLAASIGVGNEFVVDCNISLDNNFVIQGDTCELSNTSHVVEGTVSKVNPTAQGKTARVEFKSDDITAGETFDITFEKVGGTTYTTVPNGALNQDNDGYFLNQIKRRDGILGKEYYLERLDVFIGDSDSQNTVIVKGVTFFEPIVLVSDIPVQAGDVVLLENAGDFFEA